MLSLGRLWIPAALIIVTFISGVFWPVVVLAGSQQVRPPAVAGQFYSDKPDRLRAAVRNFLDDALPPQTGASPPLVLISPHAGYIYSGQIAGDAFRQASDHEYDLVVILGTKHKAALCNGVSIYQGRGYRTPLGVAEIDRDVARGLLRADRSFVFVPEVHEREHSIEVQIPFVQVAFPKARIVAAVVCSTDRELCERFGRELARVLKNRRALVVASCDLSHFPGYADAVAVDTTTLAAMAEMDPGKLQQTVQRQIKRGRPGLSTCACGLAPVMAALTVARELGSGGGRVISYINGGDCALGDHSRVVGYGAVAFAAGGRPDISALQRPETAGRSATISTADRAALLAFARRTIDQYLRTETTPVARGFSPALNRRQGAFVTLNKGQQLRGCIGHMAEDKPLGQVVGAMALQAAFNDQRFSPLQPAELAQVQIEISVLTPYTAVPGHEAIEIGRDGIMIRKNGKSAVFLPHVATEQGWDLEQTLDALCRKAGLRPGAWRSGTSFFTFQAIVFHEPESGR